MNKTRNNKKTKKEIQQQRFKDLELGEDINSILYIDSRERYDYLNSIYEEKTKSFKRNQDRTF